MIGAVAGYINNIGGCIAIGAFAGLVSGFWLRIVHPRMNKSGTFDHLGIFGTVLVNSIIGGFVVAPALYTAYFDIPITSNLLIKTNTGSRNAQFQLVLVGLAAALGVGYGLLAGVICFLARDRNTVGNDFHYSKIVSRDFGLYRESREENYLNRN